MHTCTCTRYTHTMMSDSEPSTDSMASQETVTVAALSLLMASIISSVLFFALGYICGCKCKKVRTTGALSSTIMKSSAEGSTQPVQQRHVQSGVREQDIELNENLAYGPVYADILT